MAKRILSQFLTQVNEPWKRVDLGILDDRYRVCMVWYKGEYLPHKHDADEFFLVLQGSIEIQFRSSVVKLRRGESYLIKKGRPHRSRSVRGAHVLVFEAKDLSTDEVKNLAGFR